LILVAVAVTALVVGSGKKSHRPPMQYAASSVRPAAKEAYPAKKSYPMAAAKAEIPKAAPRPAPKADKKAVAVAKPDSPRPVVAAVEKKATPAPVRVVKISPGEEARRAYQATLNAYNSGTSYDYFSHFSPWLDCWYASSGKSLDFLRSKRSKHFTRAGSKRSRFTDISIQVVSSSSDRVVLREGSTLRTTTKNTSVRRGILMKKMGGVWKVAGEVGPDADRCLPGVF